MDGSEILDCILTMKIDKSVLNYSFLITYNIDKIDFYNTHFVWLETLTMLLNNIIHILKII